MDINTLIFSQERVLGDNYPVRRVASSVNVTFLPQLKCYHQHEFRRPVL